MQQTSAIKVMPEKRGSRKFVGLTSFTKRGRPPETWNGVPRRSPRAPHRGGKASRKTPSRNPIKTGTFLACKTRSGPGGREGPQARFLAGLRELQEGQRWRFEGKAFPLIQTGRRPPRWLQKRGGRMRSPVAALLGLKASAGAVEDALPRVRADLRAGDHAPCAQRHGADALNVAWLMRCIALVEPCSAPRRTETAVALAAAELDPSNQ